MSRQTLRGQEPLTSIRCIDVGVASPALISVGTVLRRSLQIKGCCLTKQCIPSSRSSCDRVDNWYEARRERERAQNPGPRERFAEMKERKRQRKTRVAERMEAEGSSVGQQMEQDAEMCQAWLLGRCSRTTHPHLHGTEEESARIPCCSVLSSSHPNYKAAYNTCPFTRTTATCIYKHDE